MGLGLTYRARALDDLVEGSPSITPIPWRELLRVVRKNVRTNTVKVKADPLLYRL